MRPARQDTSRAWVNPLCDDMASDDGSADISPSPAQRRVSAEMAGKGKPDQADFGSAALLNSPALLNSGLIPAAHHTAHLSTSSPQVEFHL